MDRANWYKVIHDIIPTNERFHRIRMSPTDNCKEYGRTHTLSHRLTECGEGRAMWEQTKTIIARMLRMTPAHIADEWLLRPHFRLWPTQRHRAVPWVLSRCVNFRTHHHRNLKPHELMDICGDRNGNCTNCQIDTTELRISFL